MPDPEPPAELSPRKLSHELAAILVRAEQRLTVGDLIATLRGRAFDVLSVLLALPFCMPIPLPGVSTPFGLVIAALGLRLAVGGGPWLPRPLLNMELSGNLIRRVLDAARRIVHALERVVRPRWPWLWALPGFSRILGLVLLISGLLLVLPLPVPLTNFFPATAVVLVGAARLERDGVMALAGLFMFGVAGAYFGLLYVGGQSALEWLGVL